MLCTDEGECEAPLRCQPACGTGMLCHRGECISACNPACGADEVCTDEGECESSSSSQSNTEPPVSHLATDSEEAPTSHRVDFDDQAGWGLRAGVGTDISGGLGFGGILNYYFGPMLPIELNLEVFGHSSTWEGEDYGNHYEETTSLLVIAVLANYFVGYDGVEPGVFFEAGFGLAVISADWEECSPDDSSLGEPNGANGSCQSDDGTNGGTVFNLGLGFTLGGGFDLRIEAPIIILFSAPGESAGFIPTFTATLGYRF